MAGSHNIFDQLEEAIRVLKRVLKETVTLGNKSTTGTAALRFGGNVREGYEIRVLEANVVIPSAVASVDLAADIPSGSVILASQANLQTAVTATTAVKVGIGVTADPDKYGLSGALTKNTKINFIPAHAVLSGAEDVKVFACDTNGAAAGTINSGTVRVRIVFAALANLVDAA